VQEWLITARGEIFVAETIALPGLNADGTREDAYGTCSS
jgi:hypothetical protein